jgi:tetratricopeptide (TPR) repeat protein
MPAAVGLLRDWIEAEPQLSMAQWLLVDLMESSEQSIEPYLELLNDPLVRSHALLKASNGDVARLREAFSLNVGNVSAFEALAQALKSLGEWRELEALLENMLEMDVEPEKEADFVAKLVELHLGPLNQPQKALTLMRERLNGAVISDALLPVFIETALALGDTSIVDSVLSQLDVVDASETRPLRLKTHARLLMKEGRYEEAWGQLERLIRDESTDREVYEFGACVLGVLGQWGYALNVLKAGLSHVEDGHELRRLCFLMGDIHQRVLDDNFSGAGWFLEAARHGGPDAELMRCFLDAVKERDQLKSD